MALLNVEHLGFSYGCGEEPVLQDVSFAVERGEYVLLLGESGCGKTTLLRSLKSVLTPRGTMRGCVSYGGVPLAELSLRDQAAAIGYVGQDLDAQLVCDTVGHELAFGLENLGAEPVAVRARVAEMAAYLGLEPLFGRPVQELSGGEKQLVNLASVMVMRPRLLLLDEPCAQLDPLAGRMFIDAVARMNRERGVTVVMVEHRAAEMFSLASRVLSLREGRIAFDGAPEEVARRLLAAKDPVAPSLPAAARIAYALDREEERLPLDTGTGRLWFQAWCRQHPPATRSIAEEGTAPSVAAPPVIELRDVSFRYGRELPDVLSRTSLVVPRGGVHAVVGGNGSGKSTLLELMAGVHRPVRGRVRFTAGASRRSGGGAVALLPQEPIDLFAHDTVGASFEAAGVVHGARARERACMLAERFAVDRVLQRDPRDLSAGELQRAALVLVLMGEPAVLLLDEATRSLDAPSKGVLAGLLRELAAEGTTVVLSSHDLQFCAENAETIAFLFDGSVVAQAPVRSFFADTAYYTTDPAVITRPCLSDAITVAEAVAPWRA